MMNIPTKVSSSLSKREFVIVELNIYYVLISLERYLPK